MPPPNSARRWSRPLPATGSVDARWPPERRLIVLMMSSPGWTGVFCAHVLVRWATRPNASQVCAASLRSPVRGCPAGSANFRTATLAGGTRSSRLRCQPIWGGTRCSEKHNKNYHHPHRQSAAACECGGTAPRREEEGRHGPPCLQPRCAPGGQRRDRQAARCRHRRRQRRRAGPHRLHRAVGRPPDRLRGRIHAAARLTANRSFRSWPNSSSSSPRRSSIARRARAGGHGRISPPPKPTSPAPRPAW